MQVADSTLFNALDNRWEFEAGPTANSCWLTFSIDFAFKSPLYGQLATVFFKEVSPPPSFPGGPFSVRDGPPFPR